MVPCMRLYAFLGQQLAPRTDSASPYREWVAMYSSDAAEAQTARLEDLLDRRGGDSERLAWLYRRAMELERNFFQAAWDAA